MSQGSRQDGGSDLKRTPLHALHLGLGARMVPFAGYEMPVQYPEGILAEHRHTREHAGLFDVSHMGQLRLVGDNPAEALERLVPGNIAGLKAGGMRYSFLTSDAGGIIDDFVVTRYDDNLLLVVNADTKADDLRYLKDNLAAHYDVEVLDRRALLALQGPAAFDVLARHAEDASELVFMRSQVMSVAGFECFVSRSGYTGEDGFEISVESEDATTLGGILLEEEEVKPVGLGARDSLRLEAGLCLYGHDIDATTSPVEAGLAWAIGPRRRREGGFPGAARILDEISNGAGRRRVGLSIDGRGIPREGSKIRSRDGEEIGTVTSGGFGPTVDAPVAMGYVRTGFEEAGTDVTLELRGRGVQARVTEMPFVPHRYVRK